MLIEFLSLPAVIFLASTSAGLMIIRARRYVLALLGAQYLGVFLLVQQSWPFELAIVKLVAGWIATTVLGLVIFNNPDRQATEEDAWPVGKLLLLLLVVLLLISVWSIAPGVLNWLPEASPAQITGGLILISLGLLQLSLTTRPMQTILGLLTVLSGFEIIYASVERSVLVAGLLAAVTLALSLAGAYLWIVPVLEGAE